MSGWFDTIWADDLPSRAVTVYMYLRSRADREGQCVPTVRTVSRGTRSVALLVYLRMWEQMLSPLRDRMRERIAWQE